MKKNNGLHTDVSLDCKGLACPMPIVRTKKTIDGMEAGSVLEIQATDKGSLADLQAWAKNAGHHYLGTVTEGDVYKHYVRKSAPSETKPQSSHPHTATNEELAAKLADGEDVVVLDVREPAEYAFNHIPGAISIPLGQLEGRLGEVQEKQDIYVVCRTGTRSDFACQLLSERGFKQVWNVLPGMSDWSGITYEEEK